MRVTRQPWLDGWLTEPDDIAIGKPNDAYTLLLTSWFLEDQPARMDVDGNGIPCELFFEPEVVVAPDVRSITSP